MVVLGGGYLFAVRHLATPPEADSSTGVLNVNTNPPGAQVIVDGETKGVTPLSLTLKAGVHAMQLRGNGQTRSLPVSVAVGTQAAQYIELPKGGGSTGQLEVRSEPAGAQVTVDGVPRGTAPLTVSDLSPGEHLVVLQHDAGSVKQTVTIQQGVTAALVVPLAAPGGAPVSGWIAVSAPVDVELYENGRLIGTSQSERLMVAAGRHEIEIVNRALGYRVARTVQVPAGRTAPIKIEFPNTTIDINAIPWAEVWIDGEKVGDTPIGKLSVSIGPHEIVFRHPEFGEKRHAVTVTLNTPARLSVDMRKK